MAHYSFPFAESKPEKKMRKIKYSPERVKLSKFEQEIEDSITDEMINQPLSPTRAKELQEAASATSKELKNARANIRMNEGDLAEIRKLADKAGMPYQTLISHVLHLYVTNQLVNVQEVKKMVDAGVFGAKYR